MDDVMNSRHGKRGAAPVRITKKQIGMALWIWLDDVLTAGPRAFGGILFAAFPNY